MFPLWNKNWHYFNHISTLKVGHITARKVKDFHFSILNGVYHQSSEFVQNGLETQPIQNHRTFIYHCVNVDQLQLDIYDMFHASADNTSHDITYGLIKDNHIDLDLFG